MRALRTDYRMADIPDRERAMLDYAFRLTAAPASIQPSDMKALRDAGFDDRGIAQINLLTSWFNYLNRVADGLGVTRAERRPGATSS